MGNFQPFIMGILSPILTDHNAPSLRVYIGKALIEVSDGFNSKSLSDVITVLMQHV